MKRLLHWKRGRFDAILSNSTMLWIARGTLLLLLTAAVVEGWFASTAMVRRMNASHFQVQQLVSLEDSVAALDRQAPLKRLDSAQVAAFHGTFKDWDDLAVWLEGLRTASLRQGWALEWQLADSTTSGYPELLSQSVTLHITLPEADFTAAQAFLRQSAETQGRRTSLVQLEATGDHQGVSDLRWTLQLWVRPPRG